MVVLSLERANVFRIADRMLSELGLLYPRAAGPNRARHGSRASAYASAMGTLGATLQATTELAGRARDIVEFVDAHATYGETHGRLAPEVIDRLLEADLLRIWVPEELGGAELDPRRSLEVIENLSYADASTGWVMMAANLSIGTAGAYLSDRGASGLFDDDRRPVIAGQGTRPGVARRVDGGLALEGSWSFGSARRSISRFST